MAVLRERAVRRQMNRVHSHLARASNVRLRIIYEQAAAGSYIHCIQSISVYFCVRVSSGLRVNRRGTQTMKRNRTLLHKGNVRCIRI